VARFFKRLAILVGTAGFACTLFWAQEIPDAPQPRIPPPANDRFSDIPNHQTSAPAPGGRADQPTPQPSGIATSPHDLFDLSANASFVEVPVTVKTASGHLYQGLAPEDFTVYEDGALRPLIFFNSQPFPLSAAIVVDTHLRASSLIKINETLPALVGAFSEMDEVALYRYGDSVEQVQEFTASGSLTTASRQRLKHAGSEDEVPVLSGPFAVSPSVNHHPIESQRADDDERWGGHQPYIPAPRESNVLNDAILRAAEDLGRREQAGRRRVIFVLSDGRESQSTARYDEVKDLLLSHDIMVYGLGVDVAGVGILSRYAGDTGGNAATMEFDHKSIERAYQEIINEARSQYILGYYSEATPSNAYHTIEVQVRLPDLIVRAKSGYYSSPPNPLQPISAFPKK
jgi:VWFA-related protein